jgi:hypothetical protein
MRPLNESFAFSFLIDLSNQESIWHRTAIVRTNIPGHRVAANEEAVLDQPSNLFLP